MITELASKQAHPQLFDYTHQTFNVSVFNATRPRIVNAGIIIYTPAIYEQIKNIILASVYDVVIENKNRWDRFSILN